MWSRERAMAMRASKASSSYAAKGQRDAADRARNALKDVQQKRRKQKRQERGAKPPQTSEEREDGWNDTHHRTQPGALFDQKLRQSEVFRAKPRGRNYADLVASSTPGPRPT